VPGVESAALADSAHRALRIDGGTPPAPVDARRAGLAQLAVLVPVELKRALLRWRIWPIALLALAPAGLMGARLLQVNAFGRGGNESAGEMARVLAILFQGLNLRSTIFFGCAVLFTALFRGELLTRTLHYYLLTPLRRPVLLAGKYLAGVLAASLLFGGGLVAQMAFAYAPQKSFAGLAHLFAGPGLGQLASYLLVVLLACAGYGALFLWLGLLVKNPIVPVVVVLGWEGINFLLPAALKKISFLFWLQSLCPVPVQQGPLSLPAEPAPAWLAILALAGLATFFLWLGERRLRRLEVLYSD
jgi:hypothetical protein